MAIKQSKRGGKRPGAGRKRGVRDAATGSQRASLQELARAHTEVALATLERVAKGSESDAAAVSAANSILDRGYGKPHQSHEHTGTIGTYDLTHATDEEIATLRPILQRLADLAATGRGNSETPAGA